MSRRVACLVASTVLSVAVLSAPAAAREMVTVPPTYEPGTIIVRTAERKLYFVQEPGRAIRYTVAVGRPGKQWTGRKYIEGMQVNPYWGPPAEVKRDNPSLPDIVPPGPRNPLGPRAMELGPGGQYAIHGTNMPRSIGTYASYGCIRMHNEDVVDLYARVRVGTPVVVLP